MNSETATRKDRSCAILRAKAIPVLASLPVIVSESESTRRTTEAVALRAMALCVVAVKGEGLEQESVDGVVRAFDLARAFTPAEARFVSDKAPSARDRTQFAWRYECYRVLLWALGFESELPWPSDICDAEKVVQVLVSKGRAGFLREAKLRPQSEILDAADFIYRLHWAVRNAQVTGRPPVPGVDGGVVLERHYALNWLIGYAGQEWDDVSTDT